MKTADRPTARVCHEDSQPVCAWPEEWTIRVCDAHGEIVRDGPQSMGICEVCPKGCYSGGTVPSRQILVVAKQFTKPSCEGSREQYEGFGEPC